MGALSHPEARAQNLSLHLGHPRNGHLKKTAESQTPLQGAPPPRVLPGDPEVSRLLRSALLPAPKKGWDWEEEARVHGEHTLIIKAITLPVTFFPNKIMWDSQ